MDFFGKWKAVKVLKDFDENLKPVYVSAEEALKLDGYKDETSRKFITSVYEFTENHIYVVAKLEGELLDDAKKKGFKEVEKNTFIVETLDALYEDGKYYLLDTQSAENGVVPRHELKIDEDGEISFMVIMK